MPDAGEFDPAELLVTIVQLADDVAWANTCYFPAYFVPLLQHAKEAL